MNPNTPPSSDDDLPDERELAALYARLPKAEPDTALNDAVLAEAAKFVPKESIIAGTNCGMAPMRWDVAYAKLAALGRGAEMARKKFA